MSFAMSSGNRVLDLYNLACEVTAQACTQEKLFFQGGTASGPAQSNFHWTKPHNLFFACTPSAMTLWHTPQRAPNYRRCDMAS